MTPSYFEHNERTTGRSRPLGDVLELDSYLVLEGDAAGDTIRRYFDSAVRAAMAAGDAP